MRIQLHHDRVALERVLHSSNLRRLRSNPLTTSVAVQEAEQLERALLRYDYLRSLNATQSEERKLQNDYLSARQVIRERLTEVKQKNSTALVRVSSPQVISTVGSLENARHEVANILAKRRVVTDPALRRDLDRLLTIVTSLHATTAADDCVAIRVAELTNTISKAAIEIAEKIPSHARYAISAFPEKLRASGKSKPETEELIRTYVGECVALETTLKYIADYARNVSPLLIAPTNTPIELVIGFSCGKSCEDISKRLSDYGTVERFSLIPYVALRTDETHAQKLLSRPKTLFNGLEAQIHYSRKYSVKPMRARPSTDTWHLDIIRAPQAWKYSRGEESTVAIVDTGIDYDHPDLQERFTGVSGVSFISNDPYDDNGHGTHVAGIVAGKKTGVAPETKLYAVKVLDEEGSGSEIDVLKGVEWAIEQGVDVINLSLGSEASSGAEQALISEAAKRGIAVCAAAGNDGSPIYNYPGSCDGAIGVAAIDREKNRASFSNYNDCVDLSAPGVAVYSTWPGGGYETLSGTSMATPCVSGAAALLHRLPNKTAEQILKETAEKLGDSDEYGAGLINCEKAVKL